jgi:hypothetical protein
LIQINAADRKRLAFCSQTTFGVIIAAAAAILLRGYAANISIGKKRILRCPNFEQNVASGREPDAGAVRPQGYTPDFTPTGE